MRASLSGLALAAASTVLFAQPPHATQPPAPIEAAPQEAPPAQPDQAAMKELHVDQNCGVVLEDATGSYPVDPGKGERLLPSRDRPHHPSR